MLIDLLFAGGLAASMALQRPDETAVGADRLARAGLTLAADHLGCAPGLHSGLGGTLQIDDRADSQSLGPAEQGAARPLPVAGCTLA